MPLRKNSTPSAEIINPLPWLAGAPCVLTALPRRPKTPEHPVDDKKGPSASAWEQGGTGGGWSGFSPTVTEGPGTGGNAGGVSAADAGMATMVQTNHDNA